MQTKCRTTRLLLNNEPSKLTPSALRSRHLEFYVIPCAHRVRMFGDRKEQEETERTEKQISVSSVFFLINGVNWRAECPENCDCRQQRKCIKDKDRELFRSGNGV